MVEFKTLKAKEIKFGNNFIEVSRKKVITDIGENEFISISRGFYLQDGVRGWKGSITLPNDKKQLEEISKLIKTI